VRRLALLAVTLLAVGCTSAPGEPDDAAGGSAETAPTTRTEAPPAPREAGEVPAGHGHADPGRPPRAKPLRDGERFLDLTMPAAYTPSAPNGSGTDDYRCFLLDPHLDDPAFVTGVDVLPGSPAVVHHVILFQVPPDDVAAAEEQDAGEPGQGWTCFGGTGLEAGVGGDLDTAPWIGAWAPGGGETVMAPDIGIPLDPGTRIIMQVHYNLLAGEAADVSSARLRVADGDADLAPLETMLMPAPVELPCRPAHDDGPLCDREAAVADVVARFGTGAGWAVSGLQMLCGGSTTTPRAGPVQHCERPVTAPMTVRAVAGHMHLLGREITVEVKAGRDDARVLLDVPVWNFDHQ
jgi:hypothetical protein